MIEKDRTLLTRASQVNRNLGNILVEVMCRQDCGELPAEPLREVGQALRTLAEDMIARAAELDAIPVEVADV